MAVGVAPETATASPSNQNEPVKEEENETFSIQNLEPSSLGNVGLLRYRGTFANVDATFLLDCGASNFFVSYRFLQANGLLSQIKTLSPAQSQVQVASGPNVAAHGWVRVKITLDGYDDYVSAAVVDLHKGTDFILGLNWLKKYNPEVDWCDETIQFDKDGRQISLQSKRNAPLAGTATLLDEPILYSAKEFRRMWKEASTEERESLVGVQCFSLMFHELILMDRDAEDTKENHDWFPVPKVSEVHENARRARVLSSSLGHPSNQVQIDGLDALLKEFADVFQPPPAGVPDRQVKHTIPLEKEGEIPKSRMYRLSFRELEELRRRLDDFLKKGWIRPSVSPFGAPVLFAMKKDGGLRFCVDYRHLNNMTVKDQYTIPHAEDCLNQLSRGNVFSKIDLMDGYYQIPMDPKDAYKTAMRTRYGNFEWLVMPMGLTSAPATFQRLMNEVLRPLLDKCVVVYLDDILIYSETPEEHLRHVRQVLELLRAHSLHTKVSKCEFGMRELEFLGHIVSDRGVSVDPRKIEVIKNWPVPKDIKELRSFLGLANYSRRFISKYSLISAPLSDLLKKNPWNWSKECGDAFEKLKTCLMSAPVLAHPDPTKPFYLFFDASTTIAMGGVLCQADVENFLHPVAFESVKLKEAEKRYPVHELETYAFVHCLKRWRHYLDAQRFYVYTDNRSVETILTNTNPSHRLIRWIDWLQSFQFTIKHIPRSLNTVADAMSKCEHAKLSDLKTIEEDVDVEPIMLSTIRSTLLSDETLEKIKACYHDDPLWKDLYATMLRQKEDSEDDEIQISIQNYSLVDDFIVESQEPHRLCLPFDQELFREIMSVFHDSAVGGAHLGVEKTLDKLNATFYLNNAQKHVRDYVRTCDSCQRVKATNDKPAGLMVPLEVPQGRWTSISMDWITALPLTNNGHDAILVFVDRFTKRAHFHPCKTTDTAVDTANAFLENVVRLHGIPLSIVSDRDPRFVSDFWTAFCKLLGIQKKMSTSMHAQTDGQTERMNRTLEEMLRHYVNYQLDDWDSFLPCVEFAYNSSCNATLRMSPFEADVGFNPFGDIIWNGYKVTVRNATAEELTNRLNSIANQVRNAIRDAQRRQKLYYDKKRQEVNYDVGDMVLLDRTRINVDAYANIKKVKFLPRWCGPFKIVERIGKVAYRLELPPKSNAHDVFHVVALRKYDKAKDGRIIPTPDPVIVDGELEYEIEEILDERTRRRRTEYLVKWKGFPLHEATWEPRTNLEDCEALDRWEQAQASFKRGRV